MTTSDPASSPHGGEPARAAFEAPRRAHPLGFPAESELTGDVVQRQRSLWAVEEFDANGRQTDAS
jgi:hypothetical protein